MKVVFLSFLHLLLSHEHFWRQIYIAGRCVLTELLSPTEEVKVYLRLCLCSGVSWASSPRRTSCVTWLR